MSLVIVDTRCFERVETSEVKLFLRLSAVEKREMDVALSSVAAGSGWAGRRSSDMLFLVLNFKSILSGHSNDPMPLREFDFGLRKPC